MIDAKSILEALSWRYSTKQFDPSKRIDPETWNSLEEVLRLSPSSFGLQLWKFIVITDAALRQKLRSFSWDQDQVTSASHLVVFAHKVAPDESDVERHLANISGIRGTSMESLSPYKQRIQSFIGDPQSNLSVELWTAHQLYLALGMFMSACALLKIDTCPMEGFERAQFDEILGLKEQNYATAVLCAAGYRSKDDSYQGQKKVRYQKDQVIEHR